jgi:acetylornithine deacetylase
MEEAENLVLDTIDYDGMKRFVSELVSIPSFDGKEAEAQIFMIKKLSELGLRVDSWKIDFDEVKKHSDYSMAIRREEGMGVVGTMGKGKKSLILCGHIDTVSPGALENWKHPPMKATFREGNLFGRGVCDMKGGIACGLYAIKSILDSDIKLKGKLIFESVIGEEDGGVGALATCLRGYNADAGIVMEPTETKIAPVIAGAMSFTVNIQGKSTHACVREEGVSAIEKFCIIQKGLRELEKERNLKVKDPLYSRYTIPYAINIGSIEGGTWPGTVPENVSFKARMGVGIEESKDQAKIELESKMMEISNNDEWLRAHLPKVSWDGYEFAPSKVPVTHPIVKVITKSYSDACGKSPKLEGMTYASDARYLLNISNTPTIAFGPGDVRNAHGPNERVLISDLEKSVKTLALTIIRFLGYES